MVSEIFWVSPISGALSCCLKASNGSLWLKTALFITFTSVSIIKTKNNEYKDNTLLLSVIFIQLYSLQGWKRNCSKWPKTALSQPEFFFQIIKKQTLPLAQTTYTSCSFFFLIIKRKVVYVCFCSRYSIKLWEILFSRLDNTSLYSFFKFFTENKSLQVKTRNFNYELRSFNTILFYSTVSQLYWNWIN